MTALYTKYNTPAYHHQKNNILSQHTPTFSLTTKSLNLHLVIEPMANLFKSLTSFSLLRFHIEVKASHTQVTSMYLEDMDVSFTPPLLFPHKLSTYCSLNKSVVFIFCPAVRQLNGHINDRRKAIYTFCSRRVALVPKCMRVSRRVFTLVYVWKLSLSSVSTVCLASSNYGTKIHSLCLSEYAPLL